MTIFRSMTAARLLRNRRYVLQEEIGEHQGHIASHTGSIIRAEAEISSIEGALAKLDEPFDDPETFDAFLRAK